MTPPRNDIKALAYLLWESGGILGHDKDDADANWFYAEMVLRDAELSLIHQQNFRKFKEYLEERIRIMKLRRRF